MKSITNRLLLFTFAMTTCGLTLAASAHASTGDARVNRAVNGSTPDTGDTGIRTAIDSAQQRSDRAAAALAHDETSAPSNVVAYHSHEGSTSATSTSASEPIENSRLPESPKSSFSEGSTVERLTTEDGSTVIRIKDRSGKVCYAVVGNSGSGTSISCPQ